MKVKEIKKSENAARESRTLFWGKFLAQIILKKEEKHYLPGLLLLSSTFALTIN